MLWLCDQFHGTQVAAAVEEARHKSIQGEALPFDRPQPSAAKCFAALCKGKPTGFIHFTVKQPY